MFNFALCVGTLLAGFALGMSLCRFMKNMNVMLEDAGQPDDGPKQLPFPRRGYKKDEPV